MFLLLKYFSTKNQEKILEKDSKRFYGKITVPTRLFLIKIFSYINNFGRESEESKYLRDKFGNKN